MPIPKPKKGESQNDYMGRCMHFMRDEDRPQDQKVAICMRTYSDHSKSSVVDALEAIVGKFNPNHDERGRFSDGGGGSGGGGDTIKKLNEHALQSRQDARNLAAHYFFIRAQVIARQHTSAGAENFLPTVRAAIVRWMQEMETANPTDVAYRKKLASLLSNLTEAQREEVYNSRHINFVPNEISKLKEEPEVLDRLSAVAEKFNPSHDERGRFTSSGGSTVAGGGAGGSRGRGAVVLSRFQPYTPDWQDHWARTSGVLGNLATLMALSLGVVLARIAIRKGVSYVAAAVKKVKEKLGKQGTDIENLIAEIQQMSLDEQGQVLDEILGGLSDADAEAVVAAVNADKSMKFNPNHDERGRFSEGSGGGSSGGGGSGRGTGGGGGGSGGGGSASAGGYGRRWDFIVEGADKPEPFTSKWAEAWKSVSEHLGRLAVTFIRTFGTSLMAIIARKGASYVARALGIIGSSQDKATTNVTAQELLARAQALSDSDRGDLVNELLGGLSDEDAAAINAALEGKTMSSIETKDFSFDVRGLTDAGAFEGYASTFDNVDKGGDKIIKGAFSTSLKQHKANDTMPLMLWAHDPKSPIGIWKDVSEDDNGLYVKGKLLTGQNIPEADKVHSLLKAKAIRGLSIGYRVWDAEDDGDVRVLKSVELPEVSVVTFPMNDRCAVAAVKSLASDEVELMKRFYDFARDLRDGEPQPIKNLEDLLREVGIPKRMATHIVSVGYAKAIRSESGGDEAKQLLARLEAAAGAFQP